MPRPHREYIEHLERSPRPLRELALQTPLLREPFNATIMALKKFRGLSSQKCVQRPILIYIFDFEDHHARIAYLYILKSRQYKRHVVAAITKEQLISTHNTAASTKGTCGTEFVALLQARRNTTHRAMITR